MRYTSEVQDADFSLSRDSAFSYQCNACSRCCHHKAIRIEPYEALRLARHLKLSTTDFIARHTEAGGTVLRVIEEKENACSFLGAKGCTVHSDRPLACRLYPLGIARDADGVEKVGRLTPHPETAGIYGTSATVADYFAAQGVAPFLDVSARYRHVYDRMLARLEDLDAVEVEERAERRAAVDDTEVGVAASTWIDIDASVAAYCAAKGKMVPSDIETLVDLHIEAIDAWINTI